MLAINNAVEQHHQDISVFAGTWEWRSNSGNDFLGLYLRAEWNDQTNRYDHISGQYIYQKNGKVVTDTFKESDTAALYGISTNDKQLTVTVADKARQVQFTALLEITNKENNQAQWIIKSGVDKDHILLPSSLFLKRMRTRPRY